MDRLHVDHYFCIGSAHQRAGEPCQDYALSGLLADGRAYGIVCDGCSGAQARTDLGARVVGLAVEQALQQTATLAECFTPAFVQAIRVRLLSMPLGGTVQDYLASVVAFCTDGYTAKVFMAGDGGFAMRHADSGVEVTEVCWNDNAPFYLGYCLQPAIATQFAENAAANSTGVHIHTRHTGKEDATRSIPVSDFLDGWSLELDLRGIRALAVCSDGISQISTLESLEAATACLAFKNYEGSFVKRRVMKALAQWEKAGPLPQDDFSIAAWARTPEQAP